MVMSSLEHSCTRGCALLHPLSAVLEAPACLIACRSCRCVLTWAGCMAVLPYASEAVLASPVLLLQQTAQEEYHSMFRQTELCCSLWLTPAVPEEPACSMACRPCCPGLAVWQCCSANLELSCLVATPVQT